jgi:hypothetical protein
MGMGDRFQARDLMLAALFICRFVVYLRKYRHEKLSSKDAMPTRPRHWGTAMTISYNGFTCQDMYGEECKPVLQAVLMGSAQYECRHCGALTAGPWPSEKAEESEGKKA